MNRADRRRCPATGRRKHAWTTKSGEQYAGIEVCPDCGAMRDAAPVVPVGVPVELHCSRVTAHEAHGWETIQGPARCPGWPVGVQPEPAEYVCVHGKRVTDHYCGDMAENDVAPAPAVPVVHPEPASESEKCPVSWCAYPTPHGHTSGSGPSWDALLNDPTQQLDESGEVAAAVLGLRGLALTPAEREWLDNAAVYQGHLVPAVEALIRGRAAAAVAAVRADLEVEQEVTYEVTLESGQTMKATERGPVMEEWLERPARVLSTRRRLVGPWEES